MRVLVTGGAGFIGSNFVRRMLAGAYAGFEDAEMVVLDKLTYAGNLGNLADVLDDPRLRFVRADVCDRDAVEQALAGVRTVVHFAAESHVDRSVRDGDAFVASNIVGSYELLRAALRTGVDRFVLVSTDEVYGATETSSWTEDFPLRPNSPYSASKASAELIARSFHRTYGLPVCTARASNTYGPYQFPEKLIPLFVTNLLDGRTVPLYGDGSQVREWIHVDDHCRGLALIAGSGRPGESYNIGGGTEISNAELTGLLLEFLDSDWSRVRFTEDRKGHDQRYSIDCRKIREELGHRPLVDFRAGLLDTVRWYADNRDWWQPLKQPGRLPVAVLAEPH
ncbi:dTDP-glucose 4,6-dehydratase [Streptomyces lasiicapitis]|uniref:dTDP-glucose 4,6-dehydratase n=1 Tax=Streptomyces lasiicapitis TaxID=1923961 RepID=A0ABQ2MZB2_9ACTN|nr:MULTISPECIES: dTDP-glucose 4,6-dehydratase [Streptomyces]QIB42024.1 dTDP-glucose 4,6-dehydratase [Streptomyces aureoverticillatus]GGO60262.1 dTDP-glucose 4,6-dehydratase [Streptomyces lasiicapitis]